MRSINVGGAGKIKMADLKELYEELGCLDVKTVLQTGNVLFKITKLPIFSDAIESRFGHRPEVIIRRLSDLEKIIKAKPFAKYKTLSPSYQVVMFLVTEPDAQAVKSITTENEEIWSKGKELYITFPKGISRSKVTNQKIEKAIGILGTMRNWNTLEKIVSEYTQTTV